MTKKNLMGFKKASSVPDAKYGPKPVYDRFIAQVSEEKGGIYMIDTCDKTRTKSLTMTLRNRAKKLMLSNVKIITRGTEVYVVNTDSDES